MYDDFFTLYFEYAKAGINEAPTIFHRWTALSIVGTLLGRQAWFPFGHSRIYPNQYIMLMGSPGSRKSTAINVGTRLLKQTGYTRFAADRTSKERFLMDMRQFDDLTVEGTEADLEILNLEAPAEIYVVAEEFTDFVGAGNMDFITCLTKLWDNPSEYKHPKIHGKSVLVPEPTVNILSGNTSQGFALAFPPEAVGNGFLSRLIFVYGETTGRKVTFPEPPDLLVEASAVGMLKDIKKNIQGAFTISAPAQKCCTAIYEKFEGLEDHRFKHYSTRRFTHLLKLAMIIAASRVSQEIIEEDVIRANTILHFTEVRMPKAIGEYGKSKYSDVTTQIMDILYAAREPVTLTQLWKKVAKDLTKMSELIEIVKNLQTAHKVQTMVVGDKQGLLPYHEILQGWDPYYLDLSFLTQEEQIA